MMMLDKNNLDIADIIMDLDRNARRAEVFSASR